MIEAFFRRQRNRVLNITGEYSRPFWILIIALFIDRLGGALIFPFFTLYVTSKFGVSMTTVGALFGVFAFSSVIGSTLGGALADRIGRRAMLIAGLIISATSSVLMGVVNTFEGFLVVALVVGMFADIGHPAAQAMVADLLPPGKRTSGFGFLRIVANLAVVIGPAIGGVLASRSYLMLFIADAITSTITALIVFAFLPETKPQKHRDAPHESLLQTFAGYGKVFQNLRYVTFMLISVLAMMVYMQMNTTLAPFLRDVHGVPTSGFGYILTLNAGMVVIFQTAISRWTSRKRPLAMVALGVSLYGVGFALYALFGSYELFLLAMAVITIGEMVTFPVMQVIVAGYAPEDMRGRYMAAFGYTWMVASAVGPLLGGLVLDNMVPALLWVFTGLGGLVAAGGYLLLDRGGIPHAEPEPAAEVA
jgi:MFS family permease